MSSILYQALYNDLDFTTLKHCIFYFNQVEIPRYTTVISWGENNANVRFLKLIPENIQEMLSPLSNEGTIRYIDLNYGPDEQIVSLCNFIQNEIYSIQQGRNFIQNDVDEIANFIDCKSNDPYKLENVDQFSSFLAAACIVGSNLNDKACCVDNRLVFDTLNFGIKRMVEKSVQGIEKSPFLIDSLKANMLVQKVIGLNLPSFKFHTFDDVLELRLRYNDHLLALDNHLFALSKDVDGMPWDNDFSHKINELIRRKIEPELSELRRNVSSSPSKIADLIYEKGALNAALAMSFYSIYPDFLKAILFGTGKTLLDIIKNTYQNKSKALSNSPYSVFMKVR
jgi:hypothetical protein